MTPAVANLALARGTSYEVALIIQDAAAQPIDLTGYTLAASIKAASDAAPVDLAVAVTDAAAGLATVHIPAQPLGMAAWELWMQAAPETPRERALRGLVTVSGKVDPRDAGNPSTHRLIVRLSDTVTVTVDSVDLAWWAYEQTRTLLGTDYAASAQEAARAAEQARRDIDNMQADINKQVTGFDDHVATSINAVTAAENGIVDAVKDAVNSMLGFYVSADDDGTRRTHNNGKLIIGDCLFCGTSSAVMPSTHPPIILEQSPFSNLVTGSYMFYASSIAAVSIDFPRLEISTQMFGNNKAITSFSGDLPSLVDGTRMFNSCSGLIHFCSYLPSLADGSGMFYSCIALPNFDLDMPALVQGYQMFYRCLKLETFSADLPSLVEGTNMFRETKLTSFEIDMPMLENGNAMFIFSRSLSNFKSNLPSLAIGKSMFSSTSLSQFDDDLPALTDGSLMFSDTKLTSFSSAIPSLTKANQMFQDSLLDTAEINSILDRLPVMTDGQSHVIGFQRCPGAAGADKSIAVAKGWTVEI